ncbi:MAG: indolepyruvate oxidoreductase subunit beta [Spirochaetales bacterium]|nr:indolepyruvate oxidoreductase subunit beta [Spirochaetales bacterium]
MKFDIILAGVGGQGVLSVAAIIAKGAMSDGLKVRQSEVHGMSQRGGAVLSHLRISDSEICGDLVPKGGADLVLAMEPLESLRYVDYLSPRGKLVTSKNPVVNIPNYPELQSVLDRIAELDNSTIIDDKEAAIEAGAARASNMVIVGAAAPLLPIKEETLLGAIRELFASKGAEVIGINEKAFSLGAAVH